MPLSRADKIRLLSWLSAGIVIILLLRSISPSQIAEEMGKGDWPAALVFALLAALSSLICISLADFFLLRGRFENLRWRDLVRGKAGASLFIALGYGFGHGSYGLWLARHFRKSISNTAGNVSLIMLADFCSVALIAGVSASFGISALDARGQQLVQVIGLAGAAFVLALSLAGTRLLPEKIRQWKVLGPAISQWQDTRRKDYLLSLLLRLINVASLIVFTWAAARSFGLPLPLLECFSALPLIFLVGSLPINVLGLGAVQGVWVLAFASFCPEAQILAFQLIFHVFVLAGLILRSAPFLASFSRDISANDSP